jgi:hypothetical protein
MADFAIETLLEAANGNGRPVKSFGMRKAQILGANGY